MTEKLRAAFDIVDRAPAIEDMRVALSAYHHDEQCVIVGYGLATSKRGDSGWLTLLKDLHR